MNTPWEQIVAYGTIGGFIYTGIPVMKRGYDSLKLQKAIESNAESDIEKYLLRLKLDRSSIASAEKTFLAELKANQIKTVKWVGYGVFFCLYIARAKFIQTIRTSKRKE